MDKDNYTSGIDPYDKSEESKSMGCEYSIKKNKELILYTDFEGMKEFDRLLKEQLTKENLNYKERKNGR